MGLNVLYVTGFMATIASVMVVAWTSQDALFTMWNGSFFSHPSVLFCSQSMTIRAKMRCHLFYSMRVNRIALAQGTKKSLCTLGYLHLHVQIESGESAAIKSE